MTDCTLTVSRQDHPSGATVLVLAGELDHHTSPHLARALDATPFGPGTPVVIDMSELTFCDSTGITVLVSAYRRGHESNSRVTLTGVDADLMHLLRIVGLDRVFSFQPTPAHALDGS